MSAVARGSRRRSPRSAVASMALLGALVTALVTALPAGAQQVGTAIGGDTIRVGDVVPVAIRVITDRGERVAFPDTLPLADDRLENAARARVSTDTLPDGRVEATAIYSVTPWRPGELPLPPVEVPVVAGTETVRTLTATPGALEVVSVLPADTAGVEPKQARGVIGRSWSWWPILLALLAVAALIAAAIWWHRRRQAAAPAVVAPALAPRDRVLARLQEARETGLVEGGEIKAFYTLVSEAVREYLGSLETDWGEDLTTSELLARVRGVAGPAEARRIGDLLRAADQVKFARRRPDPDTAIAEWSETREWARGFRWPPEPEASREEAA